MGVVTSSSNVCLFQFFQHVSHEYEAVLDTIDDYEKHVHLQITQSDQFHLKISLLQSSAFVLKGHIIEFSGNIESSSLYVKNICKFHYSNVLEFAREEKKLEAMVIYADKLKRWPAFVLDIVTCFCGALV